MPLPRSLSLSLFLAFSPSLLFSASAAASAAVLRPPNVIVIFCDDLGYGDVGVFGAKGYATPHLDRFARDGAMFTGFHVSQPVCSASRAALLTGCYSNRLGIHGALNPKATHGLNAAETTLAELFKSRGYATGMAGKWYLGHHAPFLPDRHGFDEFLGIPYSNDMWPYHPEAKSGTYPPLPLYENGRVIDPAVTPAAMDDFTVRFTARAVSFIERNRAAPFFFYLAHPMPHVPLAVSAKFKGKSGAGLYGDVMLELDWSVGEILRALEAHGLDRDTLVIFTSDNGPWLSYGDHAGSAGPFREGKGTAWEGGTRVPCLMRWPGKIPAGLRSDATFMTIDLLPTLARLIDAPLPTPRSFNASKLSPKNAAPTSATRSPAAPAPASAHLAGSPRDFPLISVQAQSSSLSFHPVHCLFHRPSVLHFVHSSSLEPSGSFATPKFDDAPLFIHPVPRPTVKTSPLP